MAVQAEETIPMLSMNHFDKDDSVNTAPDDKVRLGFSAQHRPEVGLSSLGTMLVNVDDVTVTTCASELTLFL